MSRGTPATAKEAGTTGSASVRERILDTAADLFYQEGVRAVGVDLVVERSGVAKTSLYRHFTTKDELVAAVLERDDTNYWIAWDKTATRHRNAPRDELKAHLQWIARDIAAPKYRGCPFLNVATEFPAPDHPARAVALRHKAELRRRLGTLARQIGVARPDNLANQIALLIDGAYVCGQLAKEAAQPLLPAALALISVADNPG
ncbi:TetR/AcrR family transcriptional regulator [Paraburkholderia sp. RP-4-7]|uniref:TetR/AcrR family transcriptional regulator n=1 Tax=Paraburkholderia polaris TaxID=2728848 RepID=A0A848I2E6_9BURK|nr:TetR/AcrR family transcriptional regulator [Paraburkholderia polaris]NML96397.1 TetR/AcrR family transcriptional regulator [Paraburkholderia polaris]